MPRGDVNRVIRKWRPSLGLLIATVLGLVLSLALGVVFLFQFYTNQLIQQTEESLLAQATLLSESYAEAYGALDDGVARGVPAPAGLLPGPGTPYRPIEPRLSLADRIPPPRSDPVPASEPPAPIYEAAGERLSPVTERSQVRSLAGYRLIDDRGTVIGGTGEVGLSLAHVPEVAAALEGRIVTLLRHRELDEPAPPVYSISRGTRVRVFVAMPVIADQRVVGAVYLSRTPSNIVRYVHAQRGNLILAGLVMLVCTGLIGFLFWRFVSRPIYGLIRRVDGIAEGEPESLTPLDHYGTSEMAKLGQNLLSMARTVNDRQQAVQTFTAHVTHELKSPLTSVAGAAELMLEKGDQMPEGDRIRFLRNISRDSARMTRLLDRLRDLAAARLPGTAGTSSLGQLRGALAERFAELELTVDGPGTPIPMAPDGLEVVLTHLLENAAAHGAGSVLMRADATEDAVTLDVIDDGQGISPANRAKVLEPFFTTRRDEGGTGMGLSIVHSMMTARGGRIELLETKQGTAFRLIFEAA